MSRGKDGAQHQCRVVRARYQGHPRIRRISGRIRSLYGDQIRRGDRERQTGRGRVGARARPPSARSAWCSSLPLGLLLFHNGSLDAADLIFFLLVGVGFAQPLMTMTLSPRCCSIRSRPGSGMSPRSSTSPTCPWSMIPCRPPGRRWNWTPCRSTGDTRIIDGLSVRIDPGSVSPWWRFRRR